MTVKVLIAHARDEEELAERLAAPIREAGYEVAHEGTVLVGDSVIDEASKLLAQGTPVVVCGTVRAMGTKWARTVVNAARRHTGVRVFVVQMEEEADTEMLSFDETIARYWEDENRAMAEVVAALQKYHPLDPVGRRAVRQNDIEARYRQIALDTFDIVDLANLPEDDRHLATQELELRRLYVSLRLKLDLPRSSEDGDSVFAALESRRKKRAKVVREAAAPDEGPFSVGARLRESRRLVILGDPGAGKTTLLRWLATAYLLRLRDDADWSALPDIADLPDEDWLPILVRCRDLPPGARTLDEMLQHSLRRTELAAAECGEIAELLRDRLQTGSAILLVDGLDEIGDAQSRSEFVRQLDQIHTAMPDAPMVVTSRIVGYRELALRLRSGFEHLTIAELTREDKDDFAWRWCDLTETADRRARMAEELIQDIHSSDRIERLTGNPMLLTTMALIKRKIGRLPQRRVELYEKSVEVLLNWRSEVDAPIDRREALPQLEYLAYAMCDAGTQQLREDEVLELLERVRSEYPNLHTLKAHSPEEFLKLLERRTGLLVETGRIRHNGTMVPVFEFRHLTLQEYLAGLSLVQGHYPGRDHDRKLAEVVGVLAGRFEKIKRRYLEELEVAESWHEALRLCIASCNDDDVDPALTAILMPLEQETDTVRARAVMAAFCLADEPNASEGTARSIIDALAMAASSMAQHPGGTSLEAAAEALNEGPWAEVLLGALSDRYVSSAPAETLHVPSLLASLVSLELNQVDLARWHDDRILELQSCDERTAVRSALHIMQVAYRSYGLGLAGEFPIETQRLASPLVTRSCGRPAERQAALWALSWLADHDWSPSSTQMRRLMEHFCLPDIDGHSIRFLCGSLANVPAGAVPTPGFRHLHTALAGSTLAELMGRWGQDREVVSELEPSLSRLGSPDDISRAQIARIVEAAGGVATSDLLRKYLRDPDPVVRDHALKGQTHLLDSIDARLLSRDVDGVYPFLDPLAPISIQERTTAAAQLLIEDLEVQSRLEALAERFGLTLVL